MFEDEHKEHLSFLTAVSPDGRIRFIIMFLYMYRTDIDINQF